MAIIQTVRTARVVPTMAVLQNVGVIRKKRDRRMMRMTDKQVLHRGQELSLRVVKQVCHLRMRCSKLEGALGT